MRVRLARALTYHNCPPVLGHLLHISASRQYIGATCPQLALRGNGGTVPNSISSTWPAIALESCLSRALHRAGNLMGYFERLPNHRASLTSLLYITSTWISDIDSYTKIQAAENKEGATQWSPGRAAGDTGLFFSFSHDYKFPIMSFGGVAASMGCFSLEQRSILLHPHPVLEADMVDQSEPLGSSMVSAK